MVGNANTRGWAIDIIIGGIVGAIVGVIVAVNVVIYAGPDDGYESTIAEVFRHHTLTGIVTVATLIAGPTLGVAISRRLRARRRGETER